MISHKINHKVLLYLIEPEMVTKLQQFKNKHGEALNVLPDFTLPEWHRKLELWLFDSDNSRFWVMFEKWVWTDYVENVWLSGNVHIYAHIRMMMIYLPIYIVGFLHTKECQQEFGYNPDGSMKPWLKMMKEK